MGQAEILKFLEDKRAYSDKWYSGLEIRRSIKVNNNGNFYNDIGKLVCFNLIEWKGDGLWNHRKLFRGNK